MTTQSRGLHELIAHLGTIDGQTGTTTTQEHPAIDSNGPVLSLGGRINYYMRYMARPDYTGPRSGDRCPHCIAQAKRYPRANIAIGRLGLPNADGDLSCVVCSRHFAVTDTPPAVGL